MLDRHECWRRRFMLRPRHTRYLTIYDDMRYVQQGARYKVVHQ